VKDNGDVVYREWAPNALRAYLIGDFSTFMYAPTLELRSSHYVSDNWDRDATPMQKNQFGVFEVTIPNKNGECAIPHDSKLKVDSCHEEAMLAQKISNCQIDFSGCSE
jgi:1,4-alpha-glucan branching enzyme